MSDAAPATAPRLDDYLDVYVAPSKVFERRRDGKFGQALVVLWVLFVLIFFGTRPAMAPIMDAEMNKGMEAAAKRNPAMTPEQMEQFKAVGAKFGMVIVIVLMPIGTLILGLGIFIATKLIGASLSYAQTTTIAVFAFFPRLIDAIVGAVQALLLDETKLTSRFAVSLGAGRFLDPATSSPLLVGLLGRVDVFTIWVTVLIGIGIKVMARTTAQKAAMGAVIVWLLGSLPAIWQAFSQR